MVELVLRRLPATLMLAMMSIVRSVLVAIPLGVTAAARPHSWHDRTIVSGSLVGISLAELWLGLLLRRSSRMYGVDWNRSQRRDLLKRRERGGTFA